jgi:hypothetical protein
MHEIALNGTKNLTLRQLKGIEALLTHSSVAKASEVKGIEDLSEEAKEALFQESIKRLNEYLCGKGPLD